ncbi:Beta-xylanase [Pleurostoma richardsiae]|uniref:Beta-xylanase n=1 Tax=Pleurostoma richardsiae TaxID=41990 RepID=A0AA38VKJ0_9PEZI|nr:Beta-xylanase [Pleurostoma richardsiae]
MVTLRTAVLALASAGIVSGDGLHARAVAAGKRYFGTEVSTTVLNDAAANAVAENSQDFGQYTCENEMKFDALEPQRGVFSYTAADRIVAQAQANGMVMRCHNLVWHSQVPSWVTGGGFDNATLISIMKNHIANVVAHYKGKCYAWDVVNEALNEDGSYRSSGSVWGSTIGPAFIPMAFAAAAEADPAAKLYYNDYNIEKAGAKSTGAQNLVRMVKQYGAPVHGVGVQGHFTTGSVGAASALVQNLEAFAALGVEVAYTELDMATPSSSPNFAQQATDYATVVAACKQVSSCVGITTWGFTDKYTWISNSLPLPWDTSLQKKAAYTSILSAWGGAATTLTTVTTTRTTTATSSSTTPAQPTTSSGSGSGCTAAHWAQCGGSGFTGCTTCASPYTCTYSNDWYSQCL